MTHPLYEDFDAAAAVNKNLEAEENDDDDIGSDLGNLFEWDDEADRVPDGGGRESNNGSVPPMNCSDLGDADAFSAFLQQNPAGLLSATPTACSTSSSNGEDANNNYNNREMTTLQMPLPTPVSDLQKQRPFITTHQQVAAVAPPQQQQQTTTNNIQLQQQRQQQEQPITLNSAVAQQQQQFTNSTQLPNPQGLTASQLAQLLASGMLELPQQQQQQDRTAQQQQQQQSANAMALQQAQQQQRGRQNEQQLQQQPQEEATVQAAPQPQTASQPQQQQQQPQVLLPFTADPNMFLQQLQFAQLQQQFQAAQAQAQAQATSQAQANAQAQAQANAAQAQANAQAQAQANAALAQANAQAQQSLAAAPATPTIQEQLKMNFSGVQKQQQQAAAASLDLEVKPPAAKKARMSSIPMRRATTTTREVAPTTTSNMSLTTAPTRSREMSACGIVSASDTDGEAPRKTRSVTAPPPMKATRAPPLDPNMSAEEKAKVHRDRNKEHARNTRLRKKAYLEKLKTTVEELCHERDTLVTERAGAANLLVEMHNTRMEVLTSFFALRSTNETRRKLWESILDESSFTCIMPVTPYRSFPASEVQVSKCQRTLLGIDSMIADTASLHVLFDSLVDRSRFPDGKIDLRYTLVTEEAVVAGNQLMARFAMTTTNAVQCGARLEVGKQGMLCCKFNSAHKIVGLEVMFDVMAFMLQLKQAAGADGFSVIPNTVHTCNRTFDKPAVITLAEPPYTIMQVNKQWEEMTGFTSEQCIGKASCAILQGDKTDKKALDAMMEEIRYKRPASAVLTNYKRSGEPFRNFLLLFPLSTDSRITHYVAITNHAMDDDPSSELPPMASAPELQNSADVSGTQQQAPAEPGQNRSSASGILPSVVFAAGLSSSTTEKPASQQDQISFPVPLRPPCSNSELAHTAGQQMPPPASAPPNSNKST